MSFDARDTPHLACRASRRYVVAERRNPRIGVPLWSDGGRSGTPYRRRWSSIGTLLTAVIYRKRALLVISVRMANSFSLTRVPMKAQPSVWKSRCRVSLGEFGHCACSCEEPLFAWSLCGVGTLRPASLSAMSKAFSPKVVTVPPGAPFSGFAVRERHCWSVMCGGAPA